MGRVCEMCPENIGRPATIFCAADSCYLCQVCDEVVHSANRLARRHVRRTVTLDEAADGSSMGDNSEARLITDVTKMSSPVNSSTDMDDAPSSNEALLTTLHQPVPMPFDDTIEYDFSDFAGDGLGSKMPALCAIDDDTLFSETKSLGRSFYGDISWESVVPDNIEHVVPDISEISAAGRNGLGVSKREALEVDMSANRKGLSTPFVDASVHVDKHRVTTVVTRTGCAVKTEAVREVTMSSTTKGSSMVGKKRSRESEEVSPSSSETSIEKQGESSSEQDEIAKGVEMRKKRRMEALARFRSKRANRSFTKKVRYECRKQLADSRPRVKGRFVRKIEMALFRKYGALYRDHLDELEVVGGKTAANSVGSSAEVAGDQCVPAL